MADATDFKTCPGCNRRFKGRRGLKAHASARTVRFSCRIAWR